MLRSLVGSEMCIRDRYQRRVREPSTTPMPSVPSEGNPGKPQFVGNLKISEEEWQLHPKSWKGPSHQLPRSVPFVNGSVENQAPNEEDSAGFRKIKSVFERRVQLGRWYQGVDFSPLGDGGLRDDLAETMIENTVGRVALPVGLAMNFTVNSKRYLIPMAMEEPSVVAAASNSAKLVQTYSKTGFEAGASRALMIGQIEIRALNDMDKATAAMEANRLWLMEKGNTFCAGMHKRGGGVVDIECRKLTHSRRPGHMVVHVHMDVCDAMGANAVNTVAEGLSNPVLEVVRGSAPQNHAASVGLCILTNLCAERRAWASLKIPTKALAKKPGKDKTVLSFSDGTEVANRIVEAYEFARADPYRASTHNKGIMNGIGGVAVATGQDWRAIEAAGHAYACMGNSQGEDSVGRYSPLTRYWIQDGCLCGKIELPVPVGTKGGVVTSHPVYSSMLSLLGNPSARELAMLIASVGLASNFAALRAMSSEGIQKGHMALHNRKPSSKL
eukprot:TRINITY_DN4886_c0_g1_i1.p1 TRINITY_DN4886_c0_g1~~TRINITY_DN4886_c0_g1_i1.p1  ORF type:complete len:551 (-),score=114.32 TRINITY_DN4886_c0_g1_i1:410-1906(-)